MATPLVHRGRQRWSLACASATPCSSSAPHTHGLCSVGSADEEEDEHGLAAARLGMLPCLSYWDEKRVLTHSAASVLHRQDFLRIIRPAAPGPITHAADACGRPSAGDKHGLRRLTRQTFPKKHRLSAPARVAIALGTPSDASSAPSVTACAARALSVEPLSGRRRDAGTSFATQTTVRMHANVCLRRVSSGCQRADPDGEARCQSVAGGILRGMRTAAAPCGAWRRALGGCEGACQLAEACNVIRHLPFVVARRRLRRTVSVHSMGQGPPTRA